MSQRRKHHALDGFRIDRPMPTGWAVHPGFADARAFRFSRRVAIAILLFVIMIYFWPFILSLK